MEFSAEHPIAAQPEKTPRRSQYHISVLLLLVTIKMVLSTHIRKFSAKKIRLAK
jgi:hypothetical protein